MGTVEARVRVTGKPDVSKDALWSAVVPSETAHASVERPINGQSCGSGAPRSGAGCPAGRAQDGAARFELAQLESGVYERDPCVRWDCPGDVRFRSALSTGAVAVAGAGGHEASPRPPVVLMRGRNNLFR